MANVSRPLVALLVATLAFFALWTLALKPSSSGGGGGSPSPAALSSAVAKAHHVAAASAAASAAESGASAAQTSANRPQSTTTSATATSAAAGAPPSQAALSGSSGTNPAASGAHGAGASVGAAGAAQAGTGAATTGTVPAIAGPASLKAALAAHQVVVMLFYNPAGADDLAVKQELDSLYPSSGALVLSAPIAQLAEYSTITGKIPVAQSPTLLFIDRHGSASEIVGFADDLEIAQRLAATLAVK